MFRISDPVPVMPDWNRNAIAGFVASGLSAILPPPE